MSDDRTLDETSAGDPRTQTVDATPVFTNAVPDISSQELDTASNTTAEPVVDVPTTEASSETPNEIPVSSEVPESTTPVVDSSPTSDPVPAVQPVQEFLQEVAVDTVIQFPTADSVPDTTSFPTTQEEPVTTEPAKYNDKYDVEENGMPDPDATVLDDADAVQLVQEFLQEAFGEQFRTAKVDFILAANKRGYDAYTQEG